MKMDEFGNKTDFIGAYNYNKKMCGNKNRCKWIIAYKMTKYIYNSNEAIIIS